jgi:hypothetical protein
MSSIYFATRPLRAYGLALLVTRTLSAQTLPEAHLTHQHDPARARVLFHKGVASLRAARASKRDAQALEAACQQFEDSLRLDRTAGTLENLASCRRDQGKISLAHALYQSAAELAEDQNNPKIASEAWARAEQIAPFRSFLTLQVRAPVPGLKLELDGSDFPESAYNEPFPIDPGEHVVVAKAAGYVTVEKRVTVGQISDTKSVEVPELVAEPPAPTAALAPPLPAAIQPSVPVRPANATWVPTSPPNRAARTAVSPWPWVVAGVGATALTVGAVSGVLSLVFEHEASDCARQPRDSCSDKTLWRAESRRDWANGVAWVGVPVGIATLGTATWMLLAQNARGAERVANLGSLTVDRHGAQLSLGGRF